MAAGLGFKTFNTGDVLSAADVNGYLMQGVLVFASTAARNAAITAPAEGQFAFTKDTNSLFYYDGAAWVASGATGDIEGVTAGTGISGGGTSGTVTITNSMATAIDAKGDLVAGTGADAFARLAVGTNDQVLTADSTAATGLKWSTPSAGGSSFVGCRLYKTANQTMTTGTWTTITYDAESFDTNGFHSTSSNTSRITIPSGKAGYYLINARINIDANATGARLGRFTVNTNELFAGIEVAGSSAAGCKYTLSTIQNLAVGDYVEFLCLHNTGSNLDFVGNSGAAHNEFSVQYLGA
jgi:hypothetical protein